MIRWMERIFDWPARRCLDQVKQRPSKPETVIWPKQPYQSSCLNISDRSFYFGKQSFQFLHHWHNCTA